MKIAFVYDALYPEIKGGVERRLYEIGKRLAKRHEVHWYSFNWWGSNKQLEREGIIIHGVGRPVHFYKGNKRDPKEAIMFSWRLLMKKVNSYDIVDCQEFPYLPSYSAKFKFADSGNFVITWHEYWGEYWGEYLPAGSRIGRLVEDNMLKLTENHVVVSKHTLQRLCKVRAGRFELIPNGIDFKAIKKVPPHREKRYDAVFVGRLVEHKNVMLLLRAIKPIRTEYPTFRVGIIGDGPQKKELETFTRRQGLQKNVEFLGFLEDFEEVIAILKSSRLLAFPSMREGFGMVVLEANASGIPVVTVDAPLNASKELILPGKNGYVSTPTPEDFAQKILLAWENSYKMRRQSISLARKYDWDNISKKLERYYKGVLHET
ncbi:lps biosynthesis rfbU related protein [Thermococcus onnurineus NA1]|uniref:Lps biosynthesis rfbU related protein n=1 Tax=Thermococcus onnurineus (strain NA1) TaxID=523850 RepID=B6YVI7_THEON|nr:MULTISPECIES: glycosyltransferase family 4 protein [Thermococcus]ACJ17311.1 lps biosynthesis rfbU related protein [Thermococcus onnurineus NA1]NJE45942.1 glycosyltransferase family 1 protein [Thermococcus sp. GR7]NJE78833.1 glycosyltransferase family 1 protein [Thermococcus sp. GR4]NJF22138.1 glycosyltransferase family 1 protein [Thermococcus sp. GR5]